MKGYKKTEAILYDYKLKKTQIECDKLSIEEINIYENHISAISYDGLKVDTSNISNPTEKEAINMISKKDLYLERIKYNTILINKIESAVNSLSDTEKEIVDHKYFAEMADCDVYNLMGLSKTVYYKTKKNIINKLRRLL
ncbi:hypothetical protein [uncultured Anaerofustis sp.]|uniref:hypothetical protein n=1 Tax=uncultured Anaerofustis sp. TaxID=904996 RepID=UPI0025F17DF1|nr:hypothetical protein [uncultured Anaerofustis sp.]